MTTNNLNNGTVISALAYKLEAGVIKPIELGSVRTTVGEYLGLSRVIPLTVGHTNDPQEIRDAIDNSELNGYEPFALKDGKVYLAPKGYLDFALNSNCAELGDKAKSSMIEVLKRESHPAFNTLGKLRLAIGDFPQADGVVLIMRDHHQTSQVSFARMTDTGLIASKGTAKSHTNWLDIPSIPKGYDGWFNVQGLTLNGVKIHDLPQTQVPEAFRKGRMVTVECLKDVFVSLRTDLNIYRTGIPPMNAIVWPTGAFKIWSELLNEQFKDLIKGKRDATNPSDVVKATKGHLRPFGAVEDFHNVCKELGSYPDSCTAVVEGTFSVAGLNLLRKGPLVRCGFGYAMPGKGLKRGEIVVPREVLVAANLLDRFEKGKSVFIEAWRNPVLPGIFGDQVTSAARFKVVGITDDGDLDIYVNGTDWLIMGGDHDGDRICLSLGRLFGLGSLCSAPLSVRKDKSNYTPAPGTDVLDRMLGLSLKLGILFNATVSVLDWCHIYGIDPNLFGLIGAEAVQAAVVRQKHNPVWSTGGKVYTSHPKAGEHLLNFSVAQSIIAAKAGELSAEIEVTNKWGKTEKVRVSPSVQPTSALVAYRSVKDAKKVVIGSSQILSDLPSASAGRLSEAVKWASRVPTTPMASMPWTSEWTFVEFIEAQLEQRIAQSEVTWPTREEERKRITFREIDNIVNALLYSQAAGTRAGDHPMDNTWGVKAFRASWSKAMRGFSKLDRLVSMSRLIERLLDKGANIWIILNALSGDYWVVRAISSDKALPIDKVWEPNPMDLSSRVKSEEHVPESFEDWAHELD